MEFCQWIVISDLNASAGTSWITVLTAMLTPTVAAFGLFIAWKQWDTNRKKLKLDLFEKRIAIYEAVKKAIAEIYTKGQTSPEMERNFLQGISGAKWVFPADLASYLDIEIWGTIVEIGRTCAEFQGAPPSEHRKLSIRQNADAKNKLGAQFSTIDAKFAPYLTLAH